MRAGRIQQSNNVISCVNEPHKVNLFNPNDKNVFCAKAVDYWSFETMCTASQAKISEVIQLI